MAALWRGRPDIAVTFVQDGGYVKLRMDREPVWRYFRSSGVTGLPDAMLTKSRDKPC